MSNKIELDKLMIEEVLSLKGGISKKVAELLYIPYPLVKGWKSRAVGIWVNEDNYYKAIEIKNDHVKEKNKR